MEAFSKNCLRARGGEKVKLIKSYLLWVNALEINFHESLEGQNYPWLQSNSFFTSSVRSLLPSFRKRICPTLLQGIFTVGKMLAIQ